MLDFYIALVVIFLTFGAFCFNVGHRRAYRVVLKDLLKGQLLFLSQRKEYLAENRGRLSPEELSKALYSYETIGQLVLGWYKYFRIVREDKELHVLKERIKDALRDYLAAIEN